jgi:hypothetical protein
VARFRWITDLDGNLPLLGFKVKPACPDVGMHGFWPSTITFCFKALVDLFECAGKC